MVAPLDLAGAIETALDRVLALSLDAAAIEATCEEIRTVAKEARMVVQEAYTAKELEEFSNRLQPAFTRALPSRRPGTPVLVQPDATGVVND